MAESFKIFSQALRELLARPQRRQSFMEIETTEEVRIELGITKEMATELKNLLAKLPNIGDTEAPRASGEGLEAKAMESVTSAEGFLERSFVQLRTGAQVLMTMSVTMFLFGLGFLVIAAIRSFTHPESAQVTGVIAGIGIIQIVFLFYQNPLRDIGRSISNSQQAMLVVMSYMLGVCLIAKSLKGTPTDNEQQALFALTQQALEQLERFTEEALEQKDATSLHKATRQAG
jgi:multisubunit Na+/H+ antiporter MnhB subunit